MNMHLRTNPIGGVGGSNRPRAHVHRPRRERRGRGGYYVDAAHVPRRPRTRAVDQGEKPPTSAPTSKLGSLGLHGSPQGISTKPMRCAIFDWFEAERESLANEREMQPW